MFGSTEIVQSGFAVSQKVVSDDFVVFLIRRPPNLTLLCTSRFRSFNFTATEELFVFGDSIQKGKRIGVDGGI